MNQYRWNKQNTAESQRLKIYVQNVHHSRKHMHSNDYTTVQSLPWWWCGPAASTRSADILSTPHHGSANCRPSLEGYPDAVVHRIQMWQIGWPHLWRDKLLASFMLILRDSVTCTVNGMISVMSTLRHQIRYVHGTQRSKFTSMISIHVQSKLCTSEWVSSLLTAHQHKKAI